MLTPTRALPRRLTVAVTAVGLTAAALTTGATQARAADPVTINVVGTSDVYDSNLIQSVIKPGFEAANPGYTLNYISKGTGAAIAYAEAGTADALIVHAASLENQFVADGYSLEPYGRAIFYGDYILAGANADPAGVGANAKNDIVQAYQDVATAGAAGKANFVSRGGTPGTTVQEHAIWALTTGVPTCKVSAANGGGASPSTTDIGGDCPSTISYPSWYHATGLTQGPNITNADTCSYSGGTNDCYVFTDRGTFNYLQTTNTPPNNLKVVTSDNAASVTGGDTLLVNSFHAYAVNPDKVGTSLHTAGAIALLDYITSPAGQKAIGHYLPSDPPFIPDAAPVVTTSALPTEVTSPGSLRITGRLHNVAPGTPALSDKYVTLMSVPRATPNVDPQKVTTAKTDSAGGFVLDYTPQVTRSYTIVTGPLTKIEIPSPTLDPRFVDQLQPSSTSLGNVSVRSSFSSLSASTTTNHLTVKGTTSPAHFGDHASITLYTRPRGTKGDFTYHARQTVKRGVTPFNRTWYLKNGSYDYYVQYNDSGYFLSGRSTTRSVTVK